MSQPFAFHREVLCVPERREELCKFHQEGLEFVQGGRKKKLILWPREHLKSTLFTQGEVTRRLLLNPNLRVLINSSKVDLARGFMGAIKGYFRSMVLVDLYGALLPGTKETGKFKNNLEELTLTSRTDFTLKEPNITCSGLDATKTSQHYDLIIHDDLVTRENVSNFQQMEKVWKVWQDSLDLLMKPHGEMWVIGTRWHPLDLYGRVIEDHVDPRCRKNGFAHVAFDCECSFDVTLRTLKNEDGSYIFPTHFDDRVAGELLRLKGRYEFSAQYLNNPADPGNVWFPHNKLKECEISPEEINERRDSLVWYMVIDPAESTDNRASYTAIACVGVDHETGIWYVDYAKQCRVDTSGFIKEVFRAYQLYNPHVVGMEKNTRKALEYVLKDEMAKRNRFFIIRDLNPQLGKIAGAKQVRIQSLGPLIEFQRIRFNRTLTDLLNILYTIPASTTWDLPDVLSYVQDLAPKGLGSKEVPKAPERAVIGGLVYARRGVVPAVLRRGRRARFRLAGGVPAAL